MENLFLNYRATNLKNSMYKLKNIFNYFKLHNYKLNS